jgi:hypothetical protein
MQLHVPETYLLLLRLGPQDMASSTPCREALQHPHSSTVIEVLLFRYNDPRLASASARPTATWPPLDAAYAQTMVDMVSELGKRQCMLSAFADWINT